MTGSHHPASGGNSKEATSRSAVLAGAVDTLVTLVALLASHSSVVLADFFKTLIEFVAVLMSWLVLQRIRRGQAHAYDYGIGKLENLHDIRSRRSGSHAFIEILLEFAPDRKVGEVQQITERLRQNLEAQIPNSRVTIGLAPSTSN